MLKLEELEARLRVLVPEEYLESDRAVEPVGMGSAGLQFGADGRVAWDRMWGSFCDLAMAGGPPHKGRLLESEGGGDGTRYERVVEEICRGVGLVTGLWVEESPVRGWVRVTCRERGMAEWMLRAITMENVAVRMREGGTIDLPAGAGFRLEKEMKSVVTVAAKTCHYWRHMGVKRRGEIARLLEGAEVVQPEGGWVGVEFGDVRAAVRGMRLLVAGGVLARREETVVLVAAGCEGFAERLR
jgi:sirohydrochlorin cobaltochelatase